MINVDATKLNSSTACKNPKIEKISSRKNFYLPLGQLYEAIFVLVSMPFHAESKFGNKILKF